MRVIADQGRDLTLEQVTAQRDLWIISASEWEHRLAEQADTIVRLRDALTEARPIVEGTLAARRSAVLAKIDASLANQGPDHCGWVETEQRPEADHD